MNCADVEILLCDYVDGTLAASQRVALEEHVRDCASCRELSEGVSEAVTFVERAAVVEPPPALLTRLLHDIPLAGVLPRKRSWFAGLFGSWGNRLLQPRYAMGMAMTVLSFSMLARFAGIEPRQLRPSDLDPVKMWVSLDNRAHRTWDRTVKYYDNLLFVIEIQSRLRDWSEQDQASPQAGRKQTPAAEPTAGANSNNSNRQKAAPKEINR